MCARFGGEGNEFFATLKLTEFQENCTDVIKKSGDGF